MATAFEENSATDLNKGSADAHVVVLGRCCRNIFRAVPANAVLLAVAIEELAMLDLPVPGSVGANELAEAIGAASELVRENKARHAAGSGRRLQPVRPSAAALAGLADLLDAFCSCVTELPGVFGDIERNMAHMQTLFGLAAEECAVLTLSMACGIASQVDSFLDKCLARTKSLEQVVGACLGLPDGTVRKVLAPNGQLGRSGIVKFDRGHRWFANAIEHHVSLRAPLTGFHHSVDELRTALVGSPVTTNFSLEDFPHARHDADMLTRLLGRARADAVTGINILLYGPVGVGKTTIAKTIAKDLFLYAIGESDSDGKEPERDQRMHALLVAQQVLKGQAGAICLVDEAEDILVPFRRGKIFVNRLLETNPVPVVYVVNDASDLSDAVKRRMTYVLELRAPPLKARQSMVRRVLEDRGLVANDADISRIAALGNIAPAIISNAAHAALLSGGGIETLLDGVKGVTQALDGPWPASSPTPEKYHPRFSCADVDLVHLAGQLVASPRQDWSLLLLGKPGTGKSATARYIAERLEMPVLQIGGQQVMRPHVGETEIALAGYFAQARAERSFLIFDEIDSFAFNRNNAARSWEVSHTNTLLELLQDHDLPMACCTNADISHGRLDPALLRRFTFKIAYGYLTPQVARELFEHMFAMPAPMALDHLDVLTPGDFSVVASKAAILGLGDNAQALCAMLAEECAVKGERSRNIGFAMPGPEQTCRLVA